MEILHIFLGLEKLLTLDVRAMSLEAKSQDARRQFLQNYLVLTHRVLGGELAVVQVHAVHGGGHQAEDEDDRGHLGGGCGHCVKSLS